MEGFSANLVFETAVISCYLMDDSYPKFRQVLKDEGYRLQIVRVKVPGQVCGLHHGSITGWRQDEGGRVYHDDGYCKVKNQCWSEEGSIIEKRAIVFPPYSKVPSTNKELMALCRQEMPDPSQGPGGFSWIQD
jgi:hypothetical protein